MASHDKETAIQLYREASDKLKNRIRINEPILKALHIDPQHFQRVALNALLTAPKLAQCTSASLEHAVMVCAETGLMPDGREAAIVPYKEKATFVPMVDGVRRLVREALPGIVLRDRLVYICDKWDYREGLYPVLEHIPGSGPKEDDDVIAGYVVANIPGASVPEFLVMTRAEILRHKAFSAYPGGWWTTHFQAMARKTVVKQLLKRLPKSRPIPFVSQAEEQAAEMAGADGPNTITIDVTEPEAAPVPAPDRDELVSEQAATEQQQAVAEQDQPNAEPYEYLF